MIFNANEILFLYPLCGSIDYYHELRILVISLVYFIDRQDEYPEVIYQLSLFFTEVSSNNYPAYGK